MKNKLNDFAKQVKVEFKAFVPATSIELTKEDYDQIISYFFDLETKEIQNEDKYYLIEDKFEAEDPKTGKLIGWDHDWGVDIYAAVVYTMDEVSETDRTKDNDWWAFPKKKAANIKQGLSGDDLNQFWKGNMKCKAAPNHQLPVWFSPNQLLDLEYATMYIFIGPRQVQWSRKENGNYVNYDVKPIGADSYEKHSMNLTNFLE